MATNVVELKNVKKIYKINNKIEVCALENINLEIKKGEFLAVMGPSGSGKTTLMNIIGLLDRPTFGEYLLNGKNVSKKSDKERAKIRNQEIGFVFQNFNLLSRVSALENVILPMIYAGVSVMERRKRAEKLLREVGLEKRLKHKPNELSGGERQRVAIARALANNPSIILADEPTGNLDSKSGHEIMEIFKKLNKEGRTIIVVTHEKAIADYAKRRINLLDGKIIGENYSN